MKIVRNQGAHFGFPKPVIITAMLSWLGAEHDTVTSKNTVIEQVSLKYNTSTAKSHRFLKRESGRWDPPTTGFIDVLRIGR